MLYNRIEKEVNVQVNFYLSVSIFCCQPQIKSSALTNKLFRNEITIKYFTLLEDISLHLYNYLPQFCRKTFQTIL